MQLGRREEEGAKASNARMPGALIGCEAYQRDIALLQEYKLSETWRANWHFHVNP